MEAIKIGLLGLGVVGQGVLKILRENQDVIEGRLGSRITVKRALVREIGKPRKVSTDDILLTTNVEDILDDAEIPIVVEVMGGVEPAKAYITAALERKKHVVTANKELISKHGLPLMKLAQSFGVTLRFEGSVAGGIPIIKPLQECLAANRIQALMGIINGTTNFILSKMSCEGREFSEVLREAQERGYAESDPSSDVDGHDAAYKLAILASLAFGTQITPDKIYTEGIRKVTPLDIEYARELGFAVKLLAIAKEVDGKIEARVHPTFIPHSHPLASVNGVFNAIFVKGNAVGDLMFYGRGAGDLPTGSAVVADVIDIIRAAHITPGAPIPSGAPASAPAGTIPFASWNGEVSVADINSVETRYYIHMQVIDRPGVLASIAKAFGDSDVSLESVIQKGRGENPVGLVFVTHRVREENVRKALKLIEKLPVVEEISNVIRVEE